MSNDKQVSTPSKRKRYYTSTGAVDQRLSRPDIALAPPTNNQGRDPKYFEQRCEALAIRALVENGTAEYILERPNHPHYMKVLEFVTNRSKGKVPDIIKQEHVIQPAVILPAKDPELPPEAEFEALPGPDGDSRS